jgi:undecaprenol kinase
MPLDLVPFRDTTAHLSTETIKGVKGQSFLRRLGFALSGLHTTFRREASFRTQLLAAAAVLAALCLTRPAATWWAIGLLTVGLVLVCELLNSALEALADRLHPEQHPEIRVAKDMAAAAVLVATLTALVVAAIFILDRWK